VDIAATGERTAPGLPDEEYWFARHEVAYRWLAARLDRATAERVIVDAGAGEGYGAAMLEPAIAVEYDAVACAHIRRTYPRIPVTRANLAALPLRDASVDAITCLQVIEHLWDLRGFLRDCRRSLRPGGELIVTTPQRLTFSPGLGRGEKPINPFHVEEFDAQQLHALLLETGFADIEMRGVHHGARLRDWEVLHGSLVAAQVQASVNDVWPAGLRQLVRSVVADDFTIDAEPVDVDDARLAAAQDLLAVARVAA